MKKTGFPVGGNSIRGFSLGMAEAVREIREMTPEQLDTRQRELDAKILQVRIEGYKCHMAEAAALNRIRHWCYYG